MIEAIEYLRIRLAAAAKTERGASAVEYGLLVALIAIIIIVGRQPARLEPLAASSTRPPKHRQLTATTAAGRLAVRRGGRCHLLEGHMSNWLRIVRRRTETGASSVEYAILVSLIALHHPGLRDPLRREDLRPVRRRPAARSPARRAPPASSRQLRPQGVEARPARCHDIASATSGGTGSGSVRRTAARPRRPPSRPLPTPAARARDDRLRGTPERPTTTGRPHAWASRNTIPHASGSSPNSRVRHGIAKTSPASV